MREALVEAHVPYPDFNVLFVSSWNLLASSCSSLAGWRSSVGDAFMHYDRDDCDARDSNISAFLACGIFVPAGAVLCHAGNQMEVTHVWS
jgi:hypothetical protein